MYKLALYQYKEDIKKISFTRFLKEEKKISLAEAKNALDRFLEGVPLLFLFNSKSDLQNFKFKAENLGAVCKEMKSQLFIESAELENKRDSKKPTTRKSSAIVKRKNKNAYSEVLMVN